MTNIEIWLITAPLAALISFYCWEWGMDLLVPFSPDDNEEC